MDVSVGCRAKKLPYIASMGIYVLKASAIRKLLYEHFPEVSINPELRLQIYTTHLCDGMCLLCLQSSWHSSVCANCTRLRTSS